MRSRRWDRWALMALLCVLIAPQVANATACTVMGKEVITIVDQADASETQVLVNLDKSSVPARIATFLDVTSIAGTTPTIAVWLRPVVDGVASTDLIGSAPNVTAAGDQWTFWGDGTLAHTDSGLDGVNEVVVGPLFNRFVIETQVTGTITDLDATVHCYLLR